MSYTVTKLINLSLKDAGIIGVGQTPNAEDSNDALTRLNWMISQWARKRWLIWALETLSKTSTGAESYTVGPSEDYNLSVRPNSIESAFLRQINVNQNVDYPLELIEAREVYNEISLKSLQTFPTYLFYDSAWPVGRIFPWPIPQPDIYQIHITVKVILSEFTALNQVIDLPPEYFQALHTNLTIILRDAFDLPPKPVLIARAKESLNVIKNSNAQIARLNMPPGMVKHNSRYNIYSDTYRG